jgi:hypothetical protein
MLRRQQLLRFDYKLEDSPDESIRGVQRLISTVVDMSLARLGKWAFEDHEKRSSHRSIKREKDFVVR